MLELFTGDVGAKIDRTAVKIGSRWKGKGQCKRVRRFEGGEIMMKRLEKRKRWQA